MPTATAARPKPKPKNCGTGAGGFKPSNTCARRGKAADAIRGGAKRLKTLEGNARMAQAHHEALARRGAAPERVNRAIDRAIALKRAAHRLRMGRADLLRSRRAMLAQGLRAAGKGRAPAPTSNGGERAPLDLTPGPDGTFGYRPGRPPTPAPALPPAAAPTPAAAPAPSPPAPAAPDPRARRRVAARLRGARQKMATADVGAMKVADVAFDPQRFQYKLGLTDTKTGVTDALHGVKKWNPDLAGTIQVWKDPADGKTYVINGHHRLALARQLGVRDINVRRLKAASALEARSIGAMTNIAQGRGTSVDAAKFFRDRSESLGRRVDRSELEAHGIPLREKTASEGLALAGLAAPIFNRVINGDLTPARAAILGGSGLDHAQQMGVMQTIEKPKKGHELTDRELAIAIADARAAGTVAKNAAGMGSLFGDDDEQVSLGFHRARVIRHIEDKLRADKKVFGTVAKAKNAEALARANNTIDTEASGRVADEASYGLGIFNQLRNTGPIARHLGRAAERLARGEKPRDVHSDAYRDVVASLRDAEKF